MENFNELLERLNNVAEFTNHIIPVLRKIAPVSDPDKKAYRQRVKTRKRNNEARAEWDAIGRCVWYDDKNQPNDIQMNYVPQYLQDAFTTILNARVASGKRTKIYQKTSDQHHTYLIEAGKFPGGTYVCFWSKPN